MAARQAVAKSFDWGQIFQRTTSQTKPRMMAFKNKTDMIVAANLKAKERDLTVNWAHYQGAINDKAIVEDFKKKFESFKVPEPKDTKSAGLAEKAKADKEAMLKFVKEGDAKIQKLSLDLNRLDALPAVEQLTVDDIREHFPQTRPDYEKYPYYPHWDIPQMEKMY